MSLATFALALALLQTASPSMFPDRLLGQWTENLANCGGEDTEGIRIEPDRVEFYEAVGRVQSMTIDPDGTVVSGLSFMGEGQSWTETTQFRLSNDLASVQIHALGQKLVLERCPVVPDL